MFKVGKVLVALLLAAFAGSALAQNEELTPTVSFTLVGGVGSMGFEFLGQGGDIDGVRNPDLNVMVGDVVEIIVVNGDGMIHDWVVAELGLASEKARTLNDSVRLVFVAEQAGTFIYLCSEPGHALPEANYGMFGNLIVSE